MGLTRIRAQQITDIDYKQAVRVVTSENVMLVGGAPNQVDGVNLSSGNRILVNGQTNKAQNGLYQVETVGAGSNGTWIRTADGNTDGEIDPGMLVMVTEGNTYADTLWKLVTNGVIVIGVTELIFVLNTAFGFGNISANGTGVVATVQNDTLSLTAGENITIVGNAASKTIEFTAIPGGNNTEIQYNNSGSFAGSTNFTFDGSNVDVGGNITAEYFLGNGSQLSGVITSAANINNGTSNVSINQPNGPITVAVNGTSNVAVVENNQLTIAANLLPSANVIYDLGSSDRRWKDIWLSNTTIYLGETPITTIGNTLLVNNLSVITSSESNSLSLAGNISGGNIISSGSVEAVDGIFTNVVGNGYALTSINGSNITGTVANATYATSAGSATIADSATTAGTVTTNAQPNITSVGTLTSLAVTGNITSGNVSGTTGAFTTVTGDGAGLSNLTGANVTGTVANATYATLAGSADSATTAGTVTTNAQPNITSVGTLSSLTVNGVSTHTGNIDVTGNINVTGNLNYKNVTDLVVGDPLIYIGADNAGNLFDLGMIVAWNDGLYQHGGWVRDASDGVWKLFGNVVAEPTTVVDFTDAIYQPMQSGAITATTGTFSGNVSTGNVSGAIGTFTSVTGNGRGLTSLDASNLDAGIVSADRLTGTYTIDISGSATTAGTVTTNAQPNITSVGTLTSLSVTGNITSGNVSGTLGEFVSVTGDGSGLSNITGANITGTVANATYATSAGSADSATTAGTVTTNAQPNITSVGTLTSLSVTNSTTTGNLDANGEVRFFDSDASNYVALKSPNTVAANVVWTLPAVDGTVGQALITNGSGQLTWGAGGGGGGIAWTTQANVPPTVAIPGDFWYDSNTQIKYQYVNDGASNVWVDQSFPSSYSILAVGNLVNTNANGVGNIGSAGGYYNTVFAKATSAQYADLAEMYQADATYKPGTVIIFGGSHEVTVSDASHDTRVAGVVSTNPSYLMNSGLNNKTSVAVALTGRVPCWVQGPVEKGDRLVNHKSGVAGKLALDQFEPGCIIGKSLEIIEDDSIKLIEIAIGRY